MRKNKRPGAFRYFRIFLILLLISSAYLTFRLIAEATYFKVSQVEVRGDPENLVSAEVVASVIGTNIILFPESQIKAKLSSSLTLERVEFDKQFPGKITVTVYFRKPLFSWQSSQGRFLVDRAGVAYKEAGTESLPQVSDQDSSVKLGERLSEGEINLVTRLLNAVVGKFTPLVIKITGRDVSLILSSNMEVLLTANGSLDREISALQLITTQAKIEGKIPRLVDLRYSKPLVTY